MKNLKMLKTGAKPAPGELVIVQGFVNTVDVETGEDEIATREQLKVWLVRHGLLTAKKTVSAKDLASALSFREALLHLLQVNNGAALQPALLKQLNRLISDCPLGVSFKADGTVSLSPGQQAPTSCIGQILAQVVKAIGEGTWYRLKACNEPTCQWAFYDSSKNHSGRWCSMSVCGSREKARAYRRRRSRS